MKMIFFFMIFLQVGCAELAMYTVSVVSGITTSLVVDKIDDKKNEKEKFDDCKNCEVDKW